METRSPRSNWVPVWDAAMRRLATRPPLPPTMSVKRRLAAYPANVRTTARRGPCCRLMWKMAWVARSPRPTAAASTTVREPVSAAVAAGWATAPASLIRAGRAMASATTVAASAVDWAAARVAAVDPAQRLRQPSHRLMPPQTPHPTPRPRWPQQDSVIPTPLVPATVILTPVQIPAARTDLGEEHW